MSGNPYGAMLGQLVGLGASIAGTIPNKQDRLQRQIAMGRAEDPAVAALRRTLAAQNAATAMGVAASQQGVNPALAQRNAQAALAQQQIATNSELARAGMQSTMQARSSDPVGTKRSGLAQGLGMFANVLGTGMATQNAGMDSGDPSGLGKSFSGLASSVMGAGMGGGMGGMGGGGVTPVPAFSGGNYTAPEPTTFQMDLPETQMPVGADGQPLFSPNAPSAAGGPPSAQFAPGAPPGSGVESLPGGMTGAPAQAPAQAPGMVVPQISLPGVQLPQSNQVPASEAIGQVTGEQPVAPPSPQFAPPTAQPAGGPLGPQSRGVPSLEGGNPDVPEPQFRPSDALPPEITSNPMAAGLLQTYDELAAVGDEAGMQAVLNVLRSFQGY